MKRLILGWLIMIFGFTYIFLIPTEPTSIKIMMKLIPMLLIITFAISTRTFLPPAYKKMIILGLFVCMIADGVIYWFLAGLITFFIGHIFYIIAFRKVARKPIPIWVAVLLIGYGVSIAILISGLQFKEGNLLLGIAIIAYIAIILIMGWLAIRTRLPLAIIGAILFMFSDSVLAIDRFVIDIPNRDAIIMISYYAAQFFLASSIGTRIAKYSVNSKNLIKYINHNTSL